MEFGLGLAEEPEAGTITSQAWRAARVHDGIRVHSGVARLPGAGTTEKPLGIPTQP